MTGEVPPSLRRIAFVVDGLRGGVIPEGAAADLRRLCVDLDSLGRLDPESGEPRVDRHTVRSLVRRYCGDVTAERLLGCLDQLPGCAFRAAVRPPARELPWFDLTDEVVILDGSPNANLGDLHLPPDPAPSSVTAAIRERFPSLEPEFLDPNCIPARLNRLASADRDEELVSLMVTLVRQLGWWAALVTAVLMAAAAISALDPSADPLQANTWAIAMFILAAGIGGWTLTVIGSCALAAP